MKKIKDSLSFTSESISDSMLNLFIGKLSSEKLLKYEYIIKGMRIGISYLTKENKPNIMNNLFGNEVTHTSVYFKLESPSKRKTGALIQYGKYKYKKNKNEIDGQKVNKCGFPYIKGGGLVFGEMNTKDFEETFCTVGNINLILSKKFSKITLKKFIELVKKNNGPGDFKNYDYLKKIVKILLFQLFKL